MNAAATYSRAFTLASKSAASGSKLRAVLDAATRGLDGPRNPAGAGNAKTASTGTYRPVGATCPAACPYLGNGCYAQAGKVEMSSRRARVDVDRSVRAAAAAIAAARATGGAARLHVSGDLGRTWRHASAYVDALVALGTAAGGTAADPVAWSYTHLPRTRTGMRQIARLASVGIMVRWSDYRGPNGAIVRSHAAPRKSGEILCPAQRSKSVTCADCKLCWTRPERTIVFSPHSAGEKRAAAASPHG